MIVSGIRCLKCKSFVYSRARHDMRYCPCGAVAVDGGGEYCKISGNSNDWKIEKMEIDATPQKLYDDWCLAKDKLGIIPGSVTRKSIKSGGKRGTR